MAALPRFISIPEAARRLGLPARDLYRMVDAGKIKAAEINGETVVSEESVEKRVPQNSPVKKEDLPEYRKYAHLKGVGIGIAEASRKYGLNFSTLRRWTLRSVIARIGQDGQKILIDEADVAYAATLYRKRGGGKQGKRIFQKGA